MDQFAGLKVGDKVYDSVYNRVLIASWVGKLHFKVEGHDTKYRICNGSDAAGNRYSRYSLDPYTDEMYAETQEELRKKRMYNFVRNYNFSGAEDSLVEAVYALLPDEHKPKS